jgi:hypothetical protein
MGIALRENRQKEGACFLLDALLRTEKRLRCICGFGGTHEHLTLHPIKVPQIIGLFHAPMMHPLISWVGGQLLSAS